MKKYKEIQGKTGREYIEVQPTHTPTPLAIKGLEELFKNEPRISEEYKAYIVRAVNSHDEMLEALRLMHKAFADLHIRGIALNTSHLSAVAFSAIARAEGL